MSQRSKKFDRGIFVLSILAGLAGGYFATLSELFWISVGLLVLYAIVDWRLRASAFEVWLALTACTLVPAVFALVTYFIRVKLR